MPVKNSPWSHAIGAWVVKLWVQVMARLCELEGEARRPSVAKTWFGLGPRYLCTQRHSAFANVSKATVARNQVTEIWRFRKSPVSFGTVLRVSLTFGLRTHGSFLFCFFFVGCMKLGFDRGFPCPVVLYSSILSTVVSSALNTCL